MRTVDWLLDLSMGVIPSASSAFTAAPLESSRLTISQSLFTQATCRGVDRSSWNEENRDIWVNLVLSIESQTCYYLRRYICVSHSVRTEWKASVNFSSPKRKFSCSCQYLVFWVNDFLCYMTLPFRHRRSVTVKTDYLKRSSHATQHTSETISNKECQDNLHPLHTCLRRTRCTLLRPGDWRRNNSTSHDKRKQQTLRQDRL